MYNLASRKCTSPPLLAPKLKNFKWKFTIHWTPDLLNQRQTCYHLCQRGELNVGSVELSIIVLDTTASQQLESLVHTMMSSHRTSLLVVHTEKGGVHPPYLTHLSYCQIMKHDLSLHRTFVHCSGVQWCCSFHHFNRLLALILVMFDLPCAAAQPQEAYFMELSTNSCGTGMFPDALWNSVWCLPPLVTCGFVTLPSSALDCPFILCSLPVLDCTGAAAPFLFHFIMTSLAVDQAVFSKVEIF